MKATMAITGLILVAFLLAHMAGNLKLLINDNGEEFNAYSHLLRRLFYPAFPPMSFLWLFRIFLIAAVVLHMWSAFKLAGRRSRNVGLLVVLLAFVVPQFQHLFADAVRYAHFEFFFFFYH